MGGALAVADDQSATVSSELAVTKVADSSPIRQPTDPGYLESLLAGPGRSWIDGLTRAERKSTARRSLDVCLLRTA